MAAIWTNEALENLWEIEKFIGQDNPQKAESFVNHLIEQADSIALYPNMGRMVPEISNPEIREIIVKKYRIVYRVHEQQIEILTVFEGHKRLRFDNAENEFPP